MLFKFRSASQALSQCGFEDLSIQVEPGKPGAEVSKGKKNYTPKKEFAYRMCAGRPTSAMPKPRFLCAPAFGRSVWWWRFGGGWLCFRGVLVVVM